LRNEELHNLRSLSNAIKVMKSKGDEMDMTCSKHGTERNGHNILVESLKGRDSSNVLDADNL
jgi:uncharacterized protein YacL